MKLSEKERAAALELTGRAVVRRRSRVERTELAVAQAVHASTPSMGSDGEVFAAWLRRIAKGQSSKAAARGLTLTYDELQRMADASPVWREALRATLAERET